MTTAENPPNLNPPSSSSPPPTLPTLVGIDVGGTFTDFIVLQGSALRVHKLPTTPQDQSEAIAAGLDELAINDAVIVHGMTVATNALLERKGAKTALLATAGFADVLIIGRQNRPHIYRLTQARPEPLVADALRFDIPERVDAQGVVLTPLDEDVLEAIATQLVAASVESLALSFLFSFRNPIHEEQAASWLRARLPELPLSLSSEILPEYREYERTSTTVINAYVQPLVARYLARLAVRLGEPPESSGVAGRPIAQHEAQAEERPVHARRARELRIMQSNGGAIGLDQAAAQAARVVLSGPAGGVVGTRGCSGLDMNLILALAQRTHPACGVFPETVWRARLISGA
jgi:N-methylhydantoinase A